MMASIDTTNAMARVPTAGMMAAFTLVDFMLTNARDLEPIRGQMGLGTKESSEMVTTKDEVHTNLQTGLFTRESGDRASIMAKVLVHGAMVGPMTENGTWDKLTDKAERQTRMERFAMMVSGLTMLPWKRNAVRYLTPTSTVFLKRAKQDLSAWLRHTPSVVGKWR